MIFKEGLIMKNILKSHNIFTLIFAAVAVLTVMCTPIFGMSDLSEYTSTFESVGLYNTSSDTFSIAQNYGISQPDGSAKSPFHIFLTAVIALNKLLFSKTVFNIHFLSTIYCVIFLVGAYFLQKNVRFEKDYLNYAFSALFGLVFLDLGYLAYFNSFYTEALMLVLIIAAAALAVSLAKSFSYAKVIALGVCGCALSGMRMSAAVTAIALGIVLKISTLGVKGGKRIVAAASAAAVIAVAVFSAFNSFVPARDVKLYSLIYNDFAVSDSGALEFFGVEEAKSDNPTIAEMSEAIEGVTYGDVVRYYAKNPKAFGENIKSAANNSYFLIQEFAPYTEANASYGFRERLPLKIWNFSKKHLPQGWVVILAFLAIYAVMAIREHIKYKKDGKAVNSAIALFAVILPVGAAAELLGVVVTMGKILVSKNMFAFGIYFDLMVITAVMWAAATLISRNEHIKSKYGVNQ